MLVLQHHAIPAATRLVAPVSLPVPGDVDVLAPRLSIGGAEHRVRMLDIAAVRISLLGETTTSATDEADAIMAAIDVILRGYPVGVPH